MVKSSGGEGGEECHEGEWGGLGFGLGTGEEEHGDTQGVEHERVEAARPCMVAH